MNLLILDEDVRFRRRLADKLKRLGHDAAVFRAWTAALGFLEGQGPADLILTELEFKATGPNGVSFARMAVRRRPGLKVLFVSRSWEAAQWVDQGLGPVLLKSVGVEKIADVVLAMDPRKGASGARRESDKPRGEGEPTVP